jgi:molecular chaperone GrpE
MMNEDAIQRKKPSVDREEIVAEENEDTGAVFTHESERHAAELQEAQNKYLRLYAEFENYKKRVTKDKEELIKYGNETLLHELLPVIDHLEMALKHAINNVSTGLVQGVEITLKELKKTLQKFGLTEIEADGEAFDPLIHHAMVQVDREDIDENTVVEEYRKGYMLKDKVIRAAMVAVSKKPAKEKKEEKTEIAIHTKEEE